MQDEEGDDKQGYRRIERGFGKFVRRFQLPENTDPAHIKVHLHFLHHLPVRELYA